MIANHLGITNEQTKEALKRLERIGAIKRSKIGSIQAVENFSTTHLSSPGPGQTYHCDVLRSDDGGMILGGPGYSVVSQGSNVTLIISAGAILNPPPPTSVLMTYAGSQDGSTFYQASGIEVRITPVKTTDGSVKNEVAVAKQIGNSLATAPCK